MINVGSLSINADNHFEPLALLRTRLLCVDLAGMELALRVVQGPWERRQDVRVVDVVGRRHFQGRNSSDGFSVALQPKKRQAKGKTDREVKQLVEPLLTSSYAGRASAAWKEKKFPRFIERWGKTKDPELAHTVLSPIATGACYSPKTPSLP